MLKKEQRPAERTKLNLFRAIAKKDLESTKTLLGEVKLSETVDSLGRWPLNVAILVGFEEGVKLLLETEGGFPLLPTRDTADPFETAFSSAYYNEGMSLPIARLLLARNEATDDDFSDALVWAASHSLHDLIEEVFEVATREKVRGATLEGVARLMDNHSVHRLLPLLKKDHCDRNLRSSETR